MTADGGQSTFAAARGDGIGLAVDIGNTTIKIAVCRRSSGAQAPIVERTWQYATADGPQPGLLDELPAPPLSWFIASVCRPAVPGLLRWIDGHRPQDTARVLDHDDLPLKVNVEMPARVGLDRLAAAVGANLLRAAHQAAIVVDAGTAITVDAVDAEGTFQGGFILPGPKLAALALATHTDQLPQIELTAAEDSIELGKNTQQAMQRGIVWGLAGGVHFLVEQLRSQVGASAAVFLAGGAISQAIASLLPDARAVPHLVLSGIAHAGWWSQEPRR